MNLTRFPYLGTDQNMPNPYVSGWLKFNNELIEIDKNNVSFAVSEGNIITTPADLATWANALLWRQYYTKCRTACANDSGHTHK